MNARLWTTCCTAAACAGIAVGGDQPATTKSTPPAINYSLAETQLPAPAFLKTLKPASTQQPTWASKADETPVAKSKSAPISSLETIPADPPKTAASGSKNEVMPLLPFDSNASKSAAVTAPTPLVEQAAMKPANAMTAPNVVPAAYLPAVDDHMKCLECLKALSGSAIEADRKAALADLAKLQAWKQMKTAYMILRRVVLTEYNTKMRSDAVALLGQAMMEHALVADTLKLSAQYDSDAAIRSMAMGQLERLAATPPDRVMR